MSKSPSIPETATLRHPKRRLNVDGEDWRFLWEYLRPRWRTLAWTCLGLILVSHANLLNLWVLGVLIGKAIPSGDYRYVGWLGLVFVTSRLGFSLFNIWNRRRLTDSIGSAVKDLRRDAMGGILKGYDLSTPFRDVRITQSILVNESRHLQDALMMLIGNTLPSFVLVLTTLVLVAGVYSGLMIVLLVAIPFFLLMMRISMGFMYRRMLDKRDAENLYQAHVSMIFHFLEHIRVRMTETLEFDAHADRLNEVRKRENDLSIGYSLVELVNVVFNAVLFSVVLFLGSKAVMEGLMGVDSLVVVFFAVNLLYSHASSLLSGYTKLLYLGDALKELRLISGEMEHAFQWKGRTPLPATGSLSFRNVSFGYPGKDVLAGLDFSIEPGNCVVLVGRNGAGKTTLVHLLMGLLRQTSGSILYGGVDIADIDMETYRRSIGYVPQKPRLMPDTVRDNLTYGIGAVTDERIKEALRLSLSEELVESLPQGLDTRLGEEGARLSGGERQRLAIAAALLVRPRILVMDEPTNHLDTEAVRCLIDSLKRLEDSPTILIVSHNREMLSMADRVLHLNNGWLKEIEPGEYLNLPVEAK